VQRIDKDHAQFPQKVPVLIRDAIAAKFRIELSECAELTHVVVEGPSCGDAEFICRWLNAAMESDRLLQQHFEREPEFRTSISGWKEYCIEFRARRNSGSFASGSRTDDHLYLTSEIQCGPRYSP